MSHAEGVNVFVKFLGLEGPVDNPVTMLALTPELLSEGGIVKALQARLTQVAEHPEGMSPEADEVRLALHAAAARLLDPSARRQAKGSGTAISGNEPVTTEPTPLEAAILLTMASMGGWNKRSRDRIGALAQAYGVPAEHVVELAESLIGRPQVMHPGTSLEPSPAAPRKPVPVSIGAALPRDLHATVRVTEPVDIENMPRQEDPGSRIVRNLVIGGGVALLGTAALIVLSVTLMRGGSEDTSKAGAQPPEPAPLAAENPSPELFPTRPKEDKPKPVAPVKTTRIGDWDDLLRDAADASTALETDPETAFTQFERAHTQMSRRWSEASGDGLVAGVDRLIEFLYRAGPNQGMAERAAELLASGVIPLNATGELTPEQVQSAAWSAGVLSRVGREKDLPSGVRNRVQEALSGAFPGASGPGEANFKAGCIAALSMMPPRLIPDGPIASDDQLKKVLDSWKAWLAGIAAVGGKDSPLYTRTVLLALDALITNGADPAQSRAAFESIGLLTTSVSWRKDDESRRWLLRWFEAPNVASTDLYALTAALAHQSGAEGVDTSMVLSGAADESARAELRDRYAAVWGLRAGESRDALMQRWIDAAKSEIEASQPASEPLAMAEQVLQMARFNRAAAQLWAGDVGDITDLLTPVARSASAPQPKSRLYREALRPNVTSGDWLVRYVAAGHNIAARRTLLGEVHAAPDPGIAEVLVEEACRGSPAQVRDDARIVLLKYNAEPAVLNALLEFAPMMPVTRENSQFVENVTLATLPPVRDPTWRVAVRRAALERLTQALAGQSDLARVDEVCEQLARLYGKEAPPKVDTPTTPDATPVAVDAPAIEVAILQHRLQWQKEAELLVASTREPLNLFQIDQLRRARLELASGRVQEFQVEQLTACELMAFVCVAEHPEKSAQAARILTELGDERRAAKHVFEQLCAVERARMKLWVLRFPEKKA